MVGITTLNNTIINGTLNINKPTFNGLLVAYSTNGAYPNDNSNRYIMLKHNTFNGNLGSNYPNPECGILMTNGDASYGHPWGFYSGVINL